MLYNLFEWPMRPGARLAVIAVANTLDLPERLLPRIASRLGSRRWESFDRTPCLPSCSQMGWQLFLCAGQGCFAQQAHDRLRGMGTSWLGEH